MSGRARDGILEVEYGFYPQDAAPVNIQKELEFALNHRTINKLKDSLTVDSREYNDYNLEFSPRPIDKYEYKGKIYVRVQANSCHGEFTLSNNQRYTNGDYVWVEVQPVKWLVDEKEKLILSEKILFAGVQFNHERNYKGDFKTTDIKRYLDECFTNDLLAQNIIVKKELSAEEKEIIERKHNPYNFDFSNVSEEEIIKGGLESNVSVFLHGRSSEGKSARVKQFDPDLEIIYLRNATPDSLNGKSVFNSTTGEMIDVPPTWFKRITKKCEEEPNKLHIIFFDEITNALPSIQGMAFNIVLDGEVNGTWKLPKNARIVAAGNDLNDSLAANTMAEPLFNRFAHAYIETTTDKWLKWASTPKNNYERLSFKENVEPLVIHPSIYAYIAYKAYGKVDVLRTPYNGEKPNADPRKWEMASKFLYATGKPEMLRALIGEELTRDFVAFVKRPVITIDDVLNGNYNEKYLECMDTSEKFATAVGLSSVEMKHFVKVREFMEKIGAEPRATFESLWAHGDEQRLEYIAELKMAELSEGGKRK